MEGQPESLLITANKLGEKLKTTTPMDGFLFGHAT